MIIADTSGLLAFFDSDEQDHDAVAALIDGTRERIAVSPFVAAELDYLVARRVGVTAELAVLRELAGPAYELSSISDEELANAADVVEHYRDANIGLTDASLVVLAGRHRTRRLLTLDHRHFHAVRTPGGERFELLP